MRKRWKKSMYKSKKLFRKTYKPLIINKTQKGIKRGGTRL